MLSQDLIQGRSYRFEVIKEKSSRNFFKIKIDEDTDYTLPKFKFQHGLPVPDFLDCYVKSVLPLSIGQDISVFINDFYEIGKSYDFTVKDIKKDTETVYELQDKYNLCFKLYNAPESLAKGNKIKWY